MCTPVSTSESATSVNGAICTPSPSVESVTIEQANEQLEPTLGGLRAALGEMEYPVCVFFFTARDDQGYWTWGYEPVVLPDGQAQLHIRSAADCRKLNDESLAEIINRVDKWYDAFFAALLAS